MIQDRNIRRLLRADAAFCFALGLAGLLAGARLADFLLPQQQTLFGFAMATAMLALGIALIAYAALLLALSLRADVPRGFVAFTAFADGLWVIGTLLLLLAFGPAFSLWGGIVLLVVAADTGLIGLLKWRALRRAALPAAA